MIPVPYVFKHVWTDGSSNNTYTVLAIHTVPWESELGYNQCPASTQNGGYSTPIVPCASTANLSAMPGLHDHR